MIIRGKVQKHCQRGCKIGYPTANLRLHKNIVQGVYLGIVKIRKQQYRCLVFVGEPKTFNDSKKRVEIYIPNFKQNLYGQWISVKLLKRIRGNRKFKDEYELIDQIKKDVQILTNDDQTLNKFRAWPK